VGFESHLEEIIREVEAQGWTHKKSKHWHLFFWPGFNHLEDKPCQIGGTGHTKGHALANLKSCLRRHGFEEQT
jgi:hypothetical protein